MKKTLLAAAGALALGASAPATDHDNIDAGRPLRFDDAETIAFRELAFEFGVGLTLPRRGDMGLDGQLEFLYGFALDTHVEVGLSPSLWGSGRGLSLGELDVAVMHSFSREIGNRPALALKAEVGFPTGSDEGGPVYRLRGIASKTARQYDRFHVNLDVEFAPDAEEGERSTRLGAILGYSRPLGYPTNFNSTMVAELGLRQGERTRDGAVFSLGLGLRRQISPRSVIDFGIQSEFASGRGGSDTHLRLIAGYSTSF